MILLNSPNLPNIEGNPGLTLLFQSVFLLLFGLAFFYLRKKAINTADKEDLKTLTEVVETVKFENGKELAILKDKLNEVSEKKVKLFDEEKNAFVEFISITSKLFWDDLSYSANLFGHNNYEELTDKVKVANETLGKAQVAYSKLKLFSTDPNLTLEAHKVLMKISHLKSQKEINANSFVSNYKWESSLVQEFTRDSKKEVDIGVMKPLFDDVKEKKEKLEGKLKEIHQVSLKVVPVFESYIDLARNHIGTL